MEFAVRGTPVTATKGIGILLLVGLAFVTYGGYDYVQQSDAVDDAVSVEATIEETSISEVGRRGVDYDVQIEFTYQYQGIKYTSDQLYPGSISETYDTRSAAQSVIESYTDGDTVTAYVDPDTPSEGFLQRQTTQGPFQFMAIGGFVLLVACLHAVGARKPGHGTELQPIRESERRQYQTLLGVDRDTVHRISRRLIGVTAVVIPLSVVGTVIALFAAESGSDSATPTERDVALTDPVGLLLGTAFLAVLVLLGSLLLYSLWSFTEYRRLRKRIPEPKPPSPFTHPTRLVTILLGNYDLDAYGKRVQRTGFVFVVVFFLIGVLVQLLVL